MALRDWHGRTLLIDLTGQTFGRWTVVSLDPTSVKPKRWHCVCECGTKRIVAGQNLRNGRSTSCGCYASEWSVEKHTTHGMHKHAAYRSWRSMSARCSLSTDPGYAEYGGRGITVCEQWRDFAGFWKDMGPTWAEGLSLDRIDNDKGYEPRNTRWATDRQQANNRRNNQMIPTPIGPMTLSNAAREFGINRATLDRRMRDGWDRNRLLEPVQFHPRWHKPKQE